MKLLLLYFTAAAAAFAQGFAPASLANRVAVFSITGGTPPLATSGTGSRVLTSTGIFYAVGATGDLDPADSGRYTYARTAANVGRVNWEGGIATTFTFSNELGGTFVSTFQGATQSGNFALAPFAAPVPLVNISTRATLAAGAALTPGFVVGGTIPRRVLVRAVGPGLAGFGVTGAAAAPVLTIFRGTTEIARATGWGADLAATFTAVGAFALAPGSRDAAVVLALAPGAYTARVEGAGEVLAEIYFVD
jgi:hypothetical protein